MAGIELGVLTMQCLDRRIPDREVLTQESGTWQERRNRDGVRVNWRFSTGDGTPGSSSSPYTHHSISDELLN